MSKIDYLSNSEFKAKGAASKAAILKASTDKREALEGRQIKFILSAPVVDRDFDLINPAGIDCERYKANPVVFLNHEHHSLPIGKCVSIGLENGALVGVVEFVDPGVPVAGPMAEAVFQLCKAGVMNAVSIGFLTREWEFAEDKERRENGGADIKACELLEFSVVGIPCNPGALIQEIAPEPEPEAAASGEPEQDKAERGAAIKRSQRKRRMERFIAALR